jgi:hypothetical protein
MGESIGDLRQTNTRIFYYKNPSQTISNLRTNNVTLYLLTTAATPGLLCQPRVIMKIIMEKQMECRLAGETEVLGENLPHRHFYPSQNPT